MSEYSKRAKYLSKRLQEISEATFDPDRYYCKRGRHIITKQETIIDQIGKVRCRIHGLQVRCYKILGNTTEGTKSITGLLRCCCYPYMRCTSQFRTTNHIAKGKARLTTYCIEDKKCLLEPTRQNA